MSKAKRDHAISSAEYRRQQQAKAKKFCENLRRTMKPFQTSYSTASPDLKDLYGKAISSWSLRLLAWERIARGEQPQ